MVLFSSGGENPSGQGIVVIYRFNRLMVSFATAQKRYSLQIAPLEGNVFHSFEFSYSITTGVQLYVNGTLHANTTTFVSRTETVTVETATSAFIGKAVTSSLTSASTKSVTVGEVTIFNQNRELLVEKRSVITGMLYFLRNTSFDEYIHCYSEITLVC